MGQTFADHEILIFDDGSQDETPGIIQRVSALDTRVRQVGSERVGLVEALRRAIHQSDAEFLARMDADDISHPERLNAMVSLLDNRNDIDIASSLVRHFVDDPGDDPRRKTLPGGMRRYESWLNSLITPEAIARDLLVESPLCHPSVVMRRAAYNKTAGYLDDGCPEDYGLWLRASLSGVKMAKVDRVLFHWRDSRRRLSRTHPRYQPDRFMALKIDYLKKTYLKTRDSASIWGAGKLGRQWSRSLQAVGWDVAEFIDIDEKKLGHKVHGQPVIPPPCDKTALRSDFILVAVGAIGARAKIRAHLTAYGFVELQDFVCVA